jgi:hypothetical protein
LAQRLDPNASLSLRLQAIALSSGTTLVHAWFPWVWVVDSRPVYCSKSVERDSNQVLVRIQNYEPARAAS